MDLYKNLYAWSLCHYLSDNTCQTLQKTKKKLIFFLNLRRQSGTSSISYLLSIWSNLQYFYMKMFLSTRRYVSPNSGHFWNVSFFSIRFWKILTCLQKITNYWITHFYWQRSERKFNTILWRYFSSFSIGLFIDLTFGTWFF